MTSSAQPSSGRQTSHHRPEDSLRNTSEAAANASPDPKTSDSRSDRLNEILLNYVEACEAGQNPARESLLNAHPDLRDELTLFFEERERLQWFGSLLRDEATDHTQSFVASDPERGRLGDFRLIREVGRGGMGIVYEAEQISLGRRVALKILPFASALDPRHLQRFRNEAAAAAHLRHENIVSVHAVGNERGVHYYAMQFVDGQSLASLISEFRTPPDDRTEASTAPACRMVTEGKPRTSQWFDWVARMGHQAAMALEHANQTGVVHRDIKPANLLLDSQGQVWITDFGLAQVANESGLTFTGELLGTLRYASPEQISGRRGVVDHRSDVYSLGATLYELLTLRPPFNSTDRHELVHQIATQEPPSPRTIVPEIPVDLETILLKSLQKDPRDRYATAQELAEDLDRFVHRRPIVARPPSLADRFWSWARRHPSAMLSGSLFLIVLTAGSILTTVLLNAERARTRQEQLRTQQAYTAEQQRAEEAESRLNLARRAVNELLIISEEELVGRPELLVIRKRLLSSALNFYQEVLRESENNPKTQAELRESTARVAEILEDLELLRSQMYFALLWQPPVREDLQMTEAQQEQVRVLSNRVNQQWVDSLKELGVTSPAERDRHSLEQARSNDAELQKILTHAQLFRLRQLGLQFEGASAFRDYSVVQAIHLSPEQREKIRLIEDETTLARIRRPPVPQNDRPEDRERRSANDRILEVLNGQQKQTWNQLIGPPMQGGFLPPGRAPRLFRNTEKPPDQSPAPPKTE